MQEVTVLCHPQVRAALDLNEVALRSFTDVPGLLLQPVMP
jgi:hypothetical protein